MKSLFRYQADPALEALADRFSDQGNGIVKHLEEFIKTFWLFLWLENPNFSISI